MINIDVAKLILEPYQPLYVDIVLNKHNHYFIKGGRQSGKTMFSALAVVLHLFKDAKSNALCLRNDYAHLRKSVYNEIKKAIWFLDESCHTSFNKVMETRFDGYTGSKAETHFQDYILSGQFKSKLQPLEIINQNTGQLISFAGASEPDKIKGLTSDRSDRYYGCIWFDEFQEVLDGIEKALSIRITCQRGDADKVVSLYTYNPPPDPRHWINNDFYKAFYKAKTWHKNYNDLPEGIISKETIKSAEHLKKTDNIRYRNMWLGEPVGNLDSLVFLNKWEEKEFDEIPDDQKWNQRPFFGADWGFGDPTTLIKSYADNEGNLFITDEVYKKGALPDELFSLFDKINGLWVGTDPWPITADNSHPGLIAQCNKQGLKISPTKKGVDRKKAGVDFLRSFKKIYIHPTRCPNAIEEFANYKYDVDKVTGENLPKIKDGNDHCIDALRYAWDTYIDYSIHPYTPEV